MDIAPFFSRLWDDYTAMTPQARRIHDAFVSAGETIVNDHVAFRTFDRSPIRLSHLEPHLLALGYTPLESYDFEAKKLLARVELLGLPINASGGRIKGSPEMLLEQASTFADRIFESTDASPDHAG